MSEKLLLVVYLTLCATSSTISQVCPSQYTFKPETKHGSSATGHCSNVSNVTADGAVMTTCLTPTSSVLFDGLVPALSGLDGNMWASQLFTTRSSINVNFTGTPDYQGVRSVEIVLFNCEQLRTDIFSIVLQTGDTTVGTGNIDDTFCDSYIKLCIPISASLEAVLYSIAFIPRSTIVHIAEVAFYFGIGCVPQLPSKCPFTDNDNTEVLSTDTPFTSDTSNVTALTSATSTEFSTQGTSPILLQSTDRTFSTMKERNLLLIVLPVLLFFLFVVACLVVSLLLLWRCYYAKHRYSITSSHNNQNSKLKGEDSKLLEQHQLVELPLSPLHSAVDCSKVAVTIPDLSESETQADSTYAKADEAIEGNVPASNSSSILMLKQQLDQHKTVTNSVSQVDTAADSLYAQVDKKIVEDNNTATDQLYASVDKNSVEKATLMNRPDAATAVDQMYAQVDKTKTGEKEELMIFQAGTVVDELYAHVDKTSKKKAKNEKPPLISETVIETDQLYAQVDKQKKAVSVEDSLDIYSVVNKPKAPQLPPKSDVLEEEEFVPPQVPPNLADDGLQLHPLSNLNIADKFVPPQVPAMSNDENNEPVSRLPSNLLVEKESPLKLPFKPDNPAGQVLSYDSTL